MKTVLCSLLLLVAPPASSETTVWRWREIVPTSAETPGPRRNGAAIYDPRGRRVVVFGGVSSSGTVGDVWAFDLASRAWQRLQTSGPAPEPRFGFDAVYDPTAHELVLWAGQGSRFFNDAWALDLSTLRWRSLAASSAPRPRYGTAGVFDATSRRLVTFGGFTDAGRFQDTQALSLGTASWSDLTPPGAKPVERCLHTAALQRSEGRMIVYGGQRAGPLADLWAFDLAAKTWTELTPSQGPTGRFFASSFLDALGRFVVFGGSTSAGNVNETWSYDFPTKAWTRQETIGAPAERNGMMTAFVEDENRLILYGGTGSRLFGDVWELVQEPAEALATWILPSSARASGGGGAFYSTRLDVVNGGTTDTTYTLKLLGHDADGRAGVEKTFALAAGCSATHADLLRDVFSVTETYGAVRVTSSSMALVVSSQTSTPAPSGGTFGQSVPALAASEWIRAGAPRTIPAIREDGAFRTNLILANATDEPLDVDVSLLAADGSPLGAKRYRLQPLGMTQVTQVVRALGVETDLASGRLVLATPTVGGAFAAYASTIDNVTNDPRTLLPR